MITSSSSKKIWALAALLTLVVGAYGCGAKQEEEETPPEQTEDELIREALLRRGSVDHAAIVEVTTMMLVGPITEFSSVLDPYNQDDPFKINSASFVPSFTRNLTKFDAYDGRTDWKPEQAKAWTARIAAGDYLVVDTSKPCNWENPHTYLEIERAQLTQRPHTTCGGRMPNEDALDVTVNFLVRGPAASDQDEGAISDGVEQATKKASADFPYLGDMNGI